MLCSSYAKCMERKNFWQSPIFEKFQSRDSRGSSICEQSSERLEFIWYFKRSGWQIFLSLTGKNFSLPLDSKALLYLDCWSMHRGKEYRSWMGKPPYQLFCYLSQLILLVSKAVLVLSGNGLLNNIRGFSTMRFWTSEIIFKHSNKKISISVFFFFLKNCVQDQLKKGIPDINIHVPTK